MDKNHLKPILFFIFSSFFLILTQPALAQVISTGVAIPIDLDAVQPEGTLICMERNEFAPCTQTYDSGMYAVVVVNPTAAFVSDQSSQLVLPGGNAIVRVSTQNGQIVTGDLLTSSTTPGVAMKADRGGYVLGTALEPYSAASPGEVGTIGVAINIHPTTVFTDIRSNLFDALRQGLAAPILTPLDALRYILAAIIIVSAFILAVVYFGRIARTSVEAIARNPLASRKIERTVIFHVILMLVLILGGIGIAYLILAL